LWKRWVVLAGVGIVFALIYSQIHDQITLESLAARESQLRQQIREHPVESVLVGYVIYAVATGLSLPGAAILSLVYGWLFGFWRGMVLVSFASTTGATLSFLLSRFLLREMIQRRFGERLRKFHRALERDGPFYLFTLRLVPAVPFFVINVGMGLTHLKTTTFWWVSQLGMLPATVVFVSAGAQVPDLNTLAQQGVGSILTWPVVLSFLALGSFPWIVKWLLRRRIPTQ